MNLENDNYNKEYQENINENAITQEKEKRHERTKLYKTIGKIDLIFISQ